MIETKEFAPTPTEDTAQFNTAFAYLERLNKIEYMIEECLIKWDLVDAFSVLESYENELDFSFKEKEREEVEEIKQQIIEILNSYPGIGKTVEDSIGQKHIVGRTIFGRLRNLLIKLNKKLRVIKHRAGMGMPSKGAGKLF